MKKIFYLLLLFAIYEQQNNIPNLNDPDENNPSYMYLPMKKNHKYGDDICYYREYDDKLKYIIYYVKPCEMGKYCQFETQHQMFGYCVDIQINPSSLSKWKESCETTVDCQSGLTCDNSKCVDTSTCTNEFFQKDLTQFQCLTTNEKIDDKYCKKYEYGYDSNNNIDWTKTITYYGNHPGLPNECGLIHYKPLNYKGYDSGNLVDDVKYIEENREWCTIGSVPDGEFVVNEKYCYSGFTLNFYPNKLYENPSKIDTSLPDKKLCVTPISVDNKNKLAGGSCIITYKISDGTPKQYNLGKVSGATCSYKTIIESERHREFADAFKEANEEDKQNCSDIDYNIYHCKNSKLIKLWYFKNHIEDYLFFKDRDQLKKVLDFKIQRKYPTYAFTKYLNTSSLLLLLFLIII